MPLETGDRFGSFEVTGTIGSGGMGEVYRAQDPRLDREVAIKVLPEAFADDSERLARFDREARILASLNHPHIAAIYGIENAGAVRGLVLELIEGPTLADRIAGKRLSIDDAVAIARQIIEALDAAHERGIVHRDLKPANIKITPEGIVKVLDFGLAKSVIQGAGGVERSTSPTITSDRTRVGTILGTPAYMSPEQARGVNTDRRTDIWAFGCVLFEMLSGGPAFAGATTSDVIAAIIEREPDWTALPRSTPQSIRSLIQRCLAKDPRSRLRDIADARFELDRPVASDNSPVDGRHQSPRGVLRWALPTLVGVATAAAILATQFRSAAPPGRLTFAINPPPGVVWGSTPTDPDPVVSPDGRLVAFGGAGPDGRGLWVHDVQTGVATPLAGTRDYTRPAWSPDSRALVYCAFASGVL
ncbi:MAG: protein kinase, partial [Vicinamibacterales bacterium]